MTCDYPSVNASPISLSRAIPNATAATSSTRISSLACICFLICGVILALYFFDADNSQSGSYFASQSPSSASADRADTEGTEVGRIRYGRKTSEFAPNNLPHLPGPFVGRDKEMENITLLLKFSKYYRCTFLDFLRLVSQH